MHFLYCNLTLLINEIKNLQAINFRNLFSVSRLSTNDILYEKNLG
jgi:hypothetical protein